jgi:hypothetical protein
MCHDSAASLYGDVCIGIENNKIFLITDPTPETGFEAPK